MVWIRWSAIEVVGNRQVSLRRGLFVAFGYGLWEIQKLISLLVCVVKKQWSSLIWLSAVLAWWMLVTWSKFYSPYVKFCLGGQNSLILFVYNNDYYFGMIYCNYPRYCQSLTEFYISPWRLTATQSSLCDTIIGNSCHYFRHYPIGVLFDLYGSSASLPWNLTVHFQVVKVLPLPPHNNNNFITVLRMWSAICWKDLFPHVGVLLRVMICMASLLDHCRII